MFTFGVGDMICRWWISWKTMFLGHEDAVTMHNRHEDFFGFGLSHSFG